MLILKKIRVLKQLQTMLTIQSMAVKVILGMMLKKK